MTNKISKLEFMALGYAAFFTLVGFIWSYWDHDSFKEMFVIEDGFTEWSTVVFLCIGMVITFRRFWLLRSSKPPVFLIMTFLLGLMFLFGAGEEISWGQRIFNIESTEFFVQNNAQGETNFHNLVVNDTKINKVIFGRGIGIMLVLYLFVFVPLYKRRDGLKRFADRWAIPIAQNYQVVAYIILLVLVQGIMDSSKKGEMLEFAGSVIFLLNVVFPYNRHIFMPSSSPNNVT